MDVRDLRKLLDESNNKLEIFSSKETLVQYEMTVRELLDLIRETLSDNEKLKLFDYEHFQRFEAYLRKQIVQTISNSEVRVQALKNDVIVEGWHQFEVIDFMKPLSDETKKQLLLDSEFLEKHEFDGYIIKEIISTMREELKIELLNDRTNLVEKWKLPNWQIVDLVKSLSDDKSKLQIVEAGIVDKYSRVDIYVTLTEDKKVEILLSDGELSRYDKERMLKSLSTEFLITFFRDNREFYLKSGINPFEIVKDLESGEQEKFVEQLENMGLSLNEKREILATLNSEVKQNIDTTMFPEEYKIAIGMETSESGRKVIVDFNRNLSDYQGLDNLIRIEPSNFTEEQKKTLMQLCDICPDMQVVSILSESVGYTSTGKEYQEAERWVQSVIEGLDPEYSPAQKMAFIDNAIGKKISYSPDFGTEVFSQSDCRALWKIIASGYGVCNGISLVEQYMLSKVGIESEIISGEGHAFLKIKNIELPLANGETVRGNTILDPTWNLTAQRFNGKPGNFCMSYEEARKRDIDSNGDDHECHKNDEELQDATINLDDESLRQLYRSIGLAQEDGKFPITDLLEKSNEIATSCINDPDRNIKEQFRLLATVCPQFARCQNSSMSILRDILLDHESLEFNKCAVNRVFDREDKNKRPVMYVYIDSPELGRTFYYADTESGQFVEMSQEEFVKRFECYETDLENSDGVRPWETIEKEKEETDLSRTSGKVVASEGEER